MLGKYLICLLFDLWIMKCRDVSPRNRYWGIITVSFPMSFIHACYTNVSVIIIFEQVIYFQHFSYIFRIYLIDFKLNFKNENQKHIFYILSCITCHIFYWFFFSASVCQRCVLALALIKSTFHVIQLYIFCALCLPITRLLASLYVCWFIPENIIRAPTRSTFAFL